MKKYSIFLAMLILIGYTSCMSFKGTSRVKSYNNDIGLNQYILDYVDAVVDGLNSKVRIDPELKYRDYLTMVTENRHLVSDHVGFKMRWQCVMDEYPDTTSVLFLPKEGFNDSVIVRSGLDTLGSDYIQSMFFSPVFETKEKGGYAFHVSYVFFDIAEGWRNDFIYRWFVRFRIDDGSVEWLDCSGRTAFPFGNDPEEVEIPCDD